MRTINVPFEDLEFSTLEQAKGKEINWHDFIIKLIKGSVSVKQSKSEPISKLMEDSTIMEDKKESAERISIPTHLAVDLKSFTHFNEPMGINTIISSNNANVSKEQEITADERSAIKQYKKDKDSTTLFERLNQINSKLTFEEVITLSLRN